jgi:regulator of replication initiation timing
MFKWFRVVQNLKEENSTLTGRVDILRKLYVAQFHENLTLALELAKERSANAETKAENDRLHRILLGVSEKGGCQ